MKKDNIVNRFNSSMPILIIVLLIYSIIIFATDQTLRLSADTTLYLSIAEKYLNGEFADAVNGYWGPFLSWLFIPFLYLGFSHVFATNALFLIFGILTIIGIWRLSFRFKITGKIRNIILLTLIPIFVHYSLIQPFDLILLCFLVFYLSIVFDNKYHERTGSGILCGVLGSFAYLTKSYAFPFFIVHFSLINILHYFRLNAQADRKQILKNALIGFILFSLISGVWIAALSNKYNHFTFSNMGKTNFAILSPGSQSNTLEFGQPMFYKGFFAPPNESAIVAWEDPSYIDVETWSPMDSLSTLKHFLKLILKNISEGLLFYESFSTLSVAIIIAYILLLCSLSLSQMINKTDLLYPLLTIIIYTGGYTLFHYEARYIWIINILLLLMGGYLLTLLLQKDFFNNKVRKNILITCFVVSFIFVPSREAIRGSKGNVDKAMHTLSEELKRYNIRGNIASNREYTPVHDAWHRTFRLTYWLKNSKYYGQARENISDDDLLNELEKHDIDYYFVWGDFFENAELLSNYKEITGGELPGFHIYYMKEKKIY